WSRSTAPWTIWCAGLEPLDIRSVAAVGAEAFGRIAIDAQLRRPEVGRQAGLVLQVSEEFFGLRQLFPHRRQERGAGRPKLEHEAVHVRAQRVAQLPLVRNLQWLERAQDRDL